MQGWLVVNGFLQSNKFQELYGYLGRAAAQEGIQLSLKSSSLLCACLEDELKVYAPDFVIFWDKDYLLAKRLEQAGIPLFNSAEAMRVCDDKMLTSVALQGKVCMPKTVLAPKTFEGVGYTDRAFLRQAAQALGFPMVVKEAFGSFGAQVYLVEDEAQLNAVVDNIGCKPFLMQEFIAESKGRDVRINVVGDEVFCAILRENPCDFRSNITGGGTGTEYVPTKAQAKLAVDACQALGLDFAGVDVLFGENDQPILCEVNSNPHFKSTFDCTGKDMSVAILRYIKEKLV